jgi:hypothetical protein
MPVRGGQDIRMYWHSPEIVAAWLDWTYYQRSFQSLCTYSIRLTRFLFYGTKGVNAKIKQIVNIISLWSELKCYRHLAWSKSECYFQTFIIGWLCENRYMPLDSLVIEMKMLFERKFEVKIFFNVRI